MIPKKLLLREKKVLQNRLKSLLAPGSFGRGLERLSRPQPSCTAPSLLLLQNKLPHQSRRWFMKLMFEPEVYAAKQRPVLPVLPQCQPAAALWKQELVNQSISAINTQEACLLRLWGDATGFTSGDTADVRPIRASAGKELFTLPMQTAGDECLCESRHKPGVCFCSVKQHRPVQPEMFLSLQSNWSPLTVQTHIFCTILTPLNNRSRL